jgi:hypothetical protein
MSSEAGKKAPLLARPGLALSVVAAINDVKHRVRRMRRRRRVTIPEFLIGLGLLGSGLLLFAEVLP